MDDTNLKTIYLLRDNDLVFNRSSSEYILRVRDMSSSERPREKLSSFGPKSLSISELVAVLFGVGTKKEDVLQMSQRILREYGEKSVANETRPDRMAEILSIPEGKACQLIAAFELGRRFYATKAGRPIYIRNASSAFEYLSAMSTLKKEQLKGLYLNSRYELVYEEIISVGSMTANIVHPREVFIPAIENGAVGVIVAHNHPSGSLVPTSADLAVSRQLKSAGTIIGIELLDHLVIASGSYRSISEEQR